MRRRQRRGGDAQRRWRRPVVDRLAHAFGAGARRFSRPTACEEGRTWCRSGAQLAGARDERVTGPRTRRRDAVDMGIHPIGRLSA